MAATPSPQTPKAPPPVDALEKKGGLLVWLLGLLGIGILVLGAAGMFVASYVMKNVQMQQSGSQVEVQTPAGEIKVDPDAAAATGLPVYPGAVISDPGAAVAIGSPDDEQLSVIAAHLRTTDPLVKVDEWYQAQLGPDFKREGPGVMLRKKDIVGIEVKSTDVAFIAQDKDTLRVVSLERKGIQTEIALARIGKQETQ